jgi:hypothetical protein
MFGGWNFSGGWISEETSVAGEFSSERTLWFSFVNCKNKNQSHSA